jgi:hypothetical protein
MLQNGEHSNKLKFRRRFRLLTSRKLITKMVKRWLSAVKTQIAKTVQKVAERSRSHLFQ